MIAGIRKFVLTVGLVLGVGAASGQGAGDPSGPPVRELLADRRFAELETLMMDAEAKYRADHRSERQLDLVLDQFYRPIEWMEQPLTQWVDASSAVEARLGRGIHYAAMGWKRRGGAAASRTSEAQFDGMRDYHALAVEDFREVISRDPDHRRTIRRSDRAAYHGHQTRWRSLVLLPVPWRGPSRTEPSAGGHSRLHHDAAPPARLSSGVSASWRGSGADQ